MDLTTIWYTYVIFGDKEEFEGQKAVKPHAAAICSIAAAYLLHTAA